MAVPRDHNVSVSAEACQRAVVGWLGAHDEPRSCLVATSRCVTDFSICDSCCWGFIWSACSGKEPVRRARAEAEACVGAECGRGAH